MVFSSVTAGWPCQWLSVGLASLDPSLEADLRDDSASRPLVNHGGAATFFGGPVRE